MELTRYYVQYVTWNGMYREEETGKVVGWPVRIVSPALSKEDAEESVRGLKSRTVADPDAYSIIPEWAWLGNQVWRDKGLSANPNARIPDWLPVRHWLT